MVGENKGPWTSLVTLLTIRDALNNKTAINDALYDLTVIFSTIIFKQNGDNIPL